MVCRVERCRDRGPLWRSGSRASCWRRPHERHFPGQCVLASSSAIRRLTPKVAAFPRAFGASGKYCHARRGCIAVMTWLSLQAVEGVPRGAVSLASRPPSCSQRTSHTKVGLPSTCLVYRPPKVQRGRELRSRRKSRTTPPPPGRVFEEMGCLKFSYRGRW